MSPADAALIGRWRDQRDAGAFAEIVSRYSGLIYATCRRILKSASEAEDVTQECFMEDSE